MTLKPVNNFHPETFLGKSFTPPLISMGKIYFFFFHFPLFTLFGLNTHFTLLTLVSFFLSLSLSFSLFFPSPWNDSIGCHISDVTFTVTCVPHLMQVSLDEVIKARVIFLYLLFTLISCLLDHQLPSNFFFSPLPYSLALSLCYFLLCL